MHSGPINRKAAVGTKPIEILLWDGGRYRARTYDPLIKSQLLYQLS
jgi:hypothetical protein